MTPNITLEKAVETQRFADLDIGDYFLHCDRNPDLLSIKLDRSTYFCFFRNQFSLEVLAPEKFIVVKVKSVDIKVSL